MYNQEELKKKIMEMLLTSVHPVAAILNDQYQHSKILSRDYTRVGFFTHFQVEADIDIAPMKSFEIGGVSADIGETKDALGFLLFVRDVLIDWLEGYTLSADAWPQNYKEVKIKFDDPNGIKDYLKIFSTK